MKFVAETGEGSHVFLKLYHLEERIKQNDQFTCIFGYNCGQDVTSNGREPDWGRALSLITPLKCGVVARYLSRYRQRPDTQVGEQKRIAIETAKEGDAEKMLERFRSAPQMVADPDDY